MAVMSPPTFPGGMVMFNMPMGAQPPAAVDTTQTASGNMQQGMYSMMMPAPAPLPSAAMYPAMSTAPTQVRAVRRGIGEDKGGLHIVPHRQHHLLPVRCFGKGLSRG